MHFSRQLPRHPSDAWRHSLEQHECGGGGEGGGGASRMIVYGTWYARTGHEERRRASSAEATVLALVLVKAALPGVLVGVVGPLAPAWLIGGAEVSRQAVVGERIGAVELAAQYNNMTPKRKLLFPETTPTAASYNSSTLAPLR